MDFKHRFQRSFKPRFAVIYPFGLLIIIFGTMDEQSLKAGVGYIIAGMLIRLWSNGYAIKNDKLTTSGPYALVRNPLYLGTFLMALGFVLVIKINIGSLWWLDPLLSVSFILALCVMYYRTIKTEQGMLLARYGAAYQDYCQKVPAMVPCLVAYNQGEKWPFSLQRLINSKEHKPAFWAVIILVAFHLKTRVLIEHKMMTQKSWLLVAICIVLIVIDIIFEFKKDKWTTK